MDRVMEMYSIYSSSDIYLRSFLPFCQMEKGSEGMDVTDKITGNGNEWACEKP